MFSWCAFKFYAQNLVSYWLQKIIGMFTKLLNIMSYHYLSYFFIIVSTNVIWKAGKLACVFLQKSNKFNIRNSKCTLHFSPKTYYNRLRIWYGTSLYYLILVELPSKMIQESCCMHWNLVPKFAHSQDLLQSTKYLLSTWEYLYLVSTEQPLRICNLQFSLSSHVMQESILLRDVLERSNSVF